MVPKYPEYRSPDPYESERNACDPSIRHFQRQSTAELKTSGSLDSPLLLFLSDCAVCPQKSSVGPVSAGSRESTSPFLDLTLFGPGRRNH